MNCMTSNNNNNNQGKDGITEGDKLFDLTGKVALVTGSSSGLGRSIAKGLASAGAKVLLVARREEKLIELAQEINLAGTTAANASPVPIPSDISSYDDAMKLANLVNDQYGGIDILINAAGINLREQCDDISLDSWEKTLDLNLKIPFFLARSFVPTMKERGWGRIVNIASLQSKRAFSNSIPYGASKGGVDQLTRAMAEEWSKFGINCNAIAPGFFPTELTAKVFTNDDLTSQLASQTAIGRNGTMKDIVGPAIFLCSAASDYVTGQTLFVDGGFTAK